MGKTVGVAVLAAGEGTRIGLNIPKPLAPVVGRTLIDFVLDSVTEFSKESGLASRIVAVVGHQKELLKEHLSSRDSIAFAHQKKQLGTADALKSYFESDKSLKDCDYTLVMCADTPLIRYKELKSLFNTLEEKSLDAVVASFTENSSHSYGRIIRGAKGLRIVEAKDATSKERQICEVNSGLYFFKTSYILEYLYKVENKNGASEFYLTDVFEVERQVDAVHFGDGQRFMGVNDLHQLEIAGRLLNFEKQEQLRGSGVRFINSSTTYIDWDSEVGARTTIYPNVSIRGKSKIGTDVKLDVGTVIENSTVEEGVEIKPYCSLENAIVRKNGVIGPYARLRPHADIGENSKIGNFVEIKKAKLSKGVKISHLSYVGDAEIGEDSNIGCGFITCNYDGANKHLTKIGKGCFIGSDSQTVAPVEIGDECFIASGSTITKSMPGGSFAISRVKQTTKEGIAKKFIKKK